MQKEEYLIKNACYSVTKYYLCKQNNKRSLLGRKQRSQVARSFPNRYQFSCTNKVTSLFSISCILRIILIRKTATFGMQNNRFYKSLTTSELNNRYSCEIFLQLCYLISLYIKGVRERKTSGRQKSTFYSDGFDYGICLSPNFDNTTNSFY